MATIVAFQLVKVAAYAYYKKSDSAGAVALRNFVGNNSFQVEAQAAEEKLREEHPLLLHDNESIQLSFQSSQDKRDASYLTSHRLLLQDVKGISITKKHNYQSIPYGSIQAFSITTTGKECKGDPILTVWSAGHPLIKIAFAKGQIDWFAVQQFMNLQVLRNFQPPSPNTDPNGEEDIQEPADLSHARGEMLLDWMASGKKDIAYTKEEVEACLKKEFPILLKNETVHLAYPWGEGMSVLTNQRILSLEVQKSLMEITLQVQTILWPCVQAMSLQTQQKAAARSSLYIRIFTNIRELPSIEQCHKDADAADSVDRKALHDFVTEQLLQGGDTAVHATTLNASLVPSSQEEEEDDDSFWTQQSNRPLDAAEMTQKFRHDSSQGILQRNEVVEMAFSSGSTILLFTTLRAIRLDLQASSSGKKLLSSLTSKEPTCTFTSIPWQSVVAFGVRSAGSIMDDTAEVLLWTEIMPDGKTKPGNAHWELEFNKMLVDIMVLKKYLAQRCFAAPGLAADSNLPHNSTPLQPDYHTSPEQMESKASQPEFEQFLQMVERDETTAILEATELNRMLHQVLPILLDQEMVAIAWRAGRDICVFTNGRILLIDIQGYTKVDRRVEYTSLPYSSIRAFSIQAEGNWHSQTQLRLYTRNTWSLAKVIRDFGKTPNGHADLITLQHFLSTILLGQEEEEANNSIWNNLDYLPSSSSLGGDGKSLTTHLDSILKWIAASSKSKEDLAEALTHKLAYDVPLLLPQEVCEQVHRNGQHVYIYTNLRVLVLDWTAKDTLLLKNLPFRWVCGYEMETAGSRDPDAEIYVLSDFHSDQRRLQQDILTKEGNVLEMQNYLTNKILF